MESLSYDGGSWNATRKGPEECEDLVLNLSCESHPIFVLADGASGAGGKQAIQIVSEVSQEWVKTFSPKSQIETEKQLNDLLAQIQKRLVERGRYQYQTTLVLIALCPDAMPTPVALLARFGNSDWLITYENEAKGMQEFTSTSRESATLGTRKAGDEIDQQWNYFSFDGAGTYRLRAFSDGVAGKALDCLASRMSITDIVKDAGNWNKYIEQIGDDDWAVGGFDVVVTRKASGSAQSSPPPPKQDDVLARLKQIEPGRFSLSRPAPAFWKWALGFDAKLNLLVDYPIISRVVGPVKVAVASPNHQEQVATKRSRWNQAVGMVNRGREKRKLIAGGALTLILLFAIVIYALRPASETSSPAPEPPNERVERRTNALRFETAQQQSLYEALQDGRNYTIYDWPQGWTLREAEFHGLILGLSKVLAETRWKVIIEVHTDQTGANQVNQTVSNQRAMELRDLLLQTGLVGPEQISAEGKGESQPIVKQEISNANKAQNRRIIVRRQL
jgi:outer membrane protein OmpA-like peptidoglycan-associated protein